MNDVNNNYSLFIFIPLISMISVMFINALLIINDDFITDNDNDNIIDSYNRIVINITIFIKFILSIFINISLFIINYIKFILPILINIGNIHDLNKQLETKDKIIDDLKNKLEDKDIIIDDLKNKLEDKESTLILTYKIIDDLKK